uniref:LAGLIDADG homing endonuclease n=1 Tax=Romanomermis culicivorax TaxID=13658 RepID=A0A915HW99_ROMCU
MKQSNNILFMYTPDNARSHDERHTAERFFNDENGIYILKVIVHAKDNGNILRSKKYIDQVLSLIDYLRYNYTAAKNNYSSLTFDTLQINHRDENRLAEKFLLAYSNPNL